MRRWILAAALALTLAPAGTARAGTGAIPWVTAAMASASGGPTRPPATWPGWGLTPRARGPTRSPTPRPRRSTSRPSRSGTRPIAPASGPSARTRDAEHARRIADYTAQTRQDRLEDGSTLNFYLDRILDADALASKSAALKRPVAAEAIRDIPFESESEAISLSLDQLTGLDAWPNSLKGEGMAPQRTAVRQAVEAALDEDTKGEVSQETRNKLNQAIDTLRRKFEATTPQLSPEYLDGNRFLKTLSGLSRLLDNQQFRKVLAQLENYKGGTIGELIVFMHSFNLRFGPARSDRQRMIYAELGQTMSQALDQVGGGKGQVAVDKSGKDFLGVADQAFQGMSWKQMDDQAKPNNK